MSAQGTVTRDRHRVSPHPPATDFRPDIQGLRAVAVGLVVLFHLWPRRLSGGYVGVDVFFVISGYLITSHLMREVTATGSVQVVRFWARRIRRLLPASLLVLAVSALAAYILLPVTAWQETARQVVASALYVQNWQLALSSVDYMAADNDPTVAQHYWSLSVEEQFYAVWPLLILLLLALAGRGRGVLTPDRARQAVLAGLATLAVASLLWSALSTPGDMGFAYFSTLTRAWEFAAGALVGVAGRTLTGSLGRACGWLGLAAVVLAGVLFTESSVFPGWIAMLPVVGTALVILAAPGDRSTAGYWLARRPMVLVGDISYSVYLVHWPLIVLAPAVLDGTVLWPAKVVILVLTLVLAWLSKTFVEDPLRQGSLLGRAPRRAYAFAALGMAVLAGGVLLAPQRVSQAEASPTEVAARIEQPDPCLGPARLLSRGCSGPVTGSGSLLVAAETVAQEKGAPAGCQATLDATRMATCVLGDSQGTHGTVALVGDSHAAAWAPTLDEVGKARGWKVIVHTKSSCPFSTARRVLEAESSDARALACEQVNSALTTALRQDRPQLLFVGARSGVYGWESVPALPLSDPATDGFADAWARAGLAPGTVVVLRAVPDTQASTIVPNCVLRNRDRLERCAAPRRTAVRPDQQEAAAAAAPRLATVVDLTAAFCDDTTCPHVIGDVIVYRDKSHLSDAYARLLGPWLDRELRARGL